jgi:hypothetical protein
MSFFNFWDLVRTEKETSYGHGPGGVFSGPGAAGGVVNAMQLPVGGGRRQRRKKKKTTKEIVIAVSQNGGPPDRRRIFQIRRPNARSIRTISTKRPNHVRLATSLSHCRRTTIRNGFNVLIVGNTFT